MGEDLSGVRLDQIVDVKTVQSLIDDFHALTGMPISLIDLQGVVLAGAGWQDVCTKFHRVCPASERNCIESDVLLTSGVPRGESRAYRCKNGLWDAVTPVFLSGEHVGNVFTGQFFFDDEDIDIARFEEQAVRYGFDPEAYIAAVRAVPRFSRQAVDSLMRFYARLAEQIARLGLANVQLAETMAARRRIDDAQMRNEALLLESQRVARLGHYTFDVSKNHWDASEVLCDLFGIDDSYVCDFEGWLGIVAEEDRDDMLVYVRDYVLVGKNEFDREYRIRRIDDDELRWVHGRGKVTSDDTGVPLTLFGTIQEVTERVKVEHALHESNRALERMVHDVAEAMGKVVEVRDPYTQGHERRVAALAKALATAMGLSPDVAHSVEMAGLLHDVGKLRVPAEILTKPGRLSDTEFRIIEEHPNQGYEILKSIAFPWPIADIVSQHHERMDGSGYPNAACGEDICIEARILAVADVVEAMASHRPYRPALGMEVALDEVKSHPELYDPDVVHALEELCAAGLVTL